MNARTHGIYCRTLTPEEEALLPFVDPGDLDEIIRLLKILLARDLEKQRILLESPESERSALILWEMIARRGDINVNTLKAKAPNFWDITDRWIARIGKLTETRANLTRNTSGDGTPGAALDAFLKRLDATRERQRGEHGQQQ